MSDPGPIWIVNAPAADYPDGRFDGVTPIAPVDVPDFEAYLHAMQELNRAYGIPSQYMTPPLDPQQPTPEQIADAAREALADMQIVLRIWPYGPLSPLTWMRALVALLTPPAPTWTTPDDDPAERAWHYGTDERGRIPEDE